MTSEVLNPFSAFYGLLGLPLTGGALYIGSEGDDPETNPIPVYWDEAGSIPATQPIETLGGYIVNGGTPARLFASEDKFSVRVRDVAGAEVFNSPSISDPRRFKSGFPGAFSREVSEKIAEIGISPRDFGAVGDGVADDTAAVQACVDACHETVVTAPMRVDGLFRLTSPVNIDRPVDTMTNRFAVFGTYVGAGFYVTSNTNLFDSTIPYAGTAPVTERVHFRDIIFMADVAARVAQTFTAGKFCRMSFENCEWIRLKVFGTTIYAQSWRFKLCRATGWTDILIESHGVYDFDAEFEVKFGDTVYAFTDSAVPVLRCSIHNGVYEGLTGNILIATSVLQLSFTNNYCEFNAGPALDFQSPGTPGINNMSSVITVEDNTFVQTNAQVASGTFYDIRWPFTFNGTSFGNRCNGRLHDTTALVDNGNLKPLLWINDHADVEAFKGLKSGPFDGTNAPVGRVKLHQYGREFLFNGTKFVGFDPDLNATMHGPGVVVGGERVPIREVSGPHDPSANPAYYGNVTWAKGSYVRNSLPAAGQPKGWICTISGAAGLAGTWVSEGNL